jgi:MerR family transcriptional regulator, light-induced transcriptional regulator
LNEGAQTGETSGSLPPMSDAPRGISIGELAARTGVAPGTLRMWEARHGFPVARRGAGGHRRYDADDVARIARVLDERGRGLSLPAAIERVRAWAPSGPPSLFAALRERAPELPAHRLPVWAMRALSEAIEDECLARARRPLLAASFQTERAYRRAEPRWRELARTADLAVVLAAFTRRRGSRSAPAEIPLADGSALHREWAVVCVDGAYTACLAGWERPRTDGARRFEAIWSTDPEAVRGTFAVALDFVGGAVAERGRELLAGLEPAPGAGEAATVALANRIVGYMSANGRG